MMKTVCLTPTQTPCLPPNTSVRIATESPGSGTIDREELHELLRDLCDTRPDAHDACRVRTGGAHCLTPLVLAEISLVQTQRWIVGLRKWITTAGGVGLGVKLNVRVDFAHPLPCTPVKNPPLCAVVRSTWWSSTTLSRPKLRQ